MIKKTRIFKVPTLRGEDIGNDVIEFLTGFAKLIDWDVYSALMIVDLSNVYIVITDDNDQTGMFYYLGYHNGNKWVLHPDNIKSAKRVRNVIDILGTASKDIEVKNLWRGKT